MASTLVGAFYFVIMTTEVDPMDAINAWQKWYKDHQVVASLDKPMESKDSRENLHDTSNTSDTMTNAEAKALWMQKAKEHFADTLAEYQYELNGKDFYKAFYAAAHENMTHAKKEYDSAKDLVDMLKYHHLGQD